MIATSPLTFSEAVPRSRPARRFISPRAGQALEKLSHAIEYLTDEFVVDRSSQFSDRGRLEAIELLMAINRSIYNDCPVIATFAERLSAWLRLAA